MREIKGNKEGVCDRIHKSCFPIPYIISPTHISSMADLADV